MGKEKPQENKGKQQPQEQLQNVQNSADHQEYLEKIVRPSEQTHIKAAIEPIDKKTSGRNKDRLKENVQFKIEQGMKKRFEKAIKHEGRVERDKILKEAEAEAKKYIDQIEAMVYNLTAQGKEELTENDLYELLKLTEAVPKTFLIPEKYQNLLLKASRGAINDAELHEIAKLVRPQKLNKNFENFRCAPVGAMIAMLKPPQRLTVAKYVVDRQPKTAKEWTEIMSATGMLSVAQAEEVWNYAKSKKILKNNFDENRMRELQEEMKKIVEKRVDWITKPDDKNPALRMLTLGNIGAFGLTVWGGLTALFNGIVAYKTGNYDGLKTYGLMGLGAMALGNKIMTNKWPLEDTLKEPSAEEKEKSAIAGAEGAIMDTLKDNPRLARYLRAGGYSTLRMAIAENPNKKLAFTDLKKYETSEKQTALRETLEKNWPETNAKNLNNVANMIKTLDGLQASAPESAPKAQKAGEYAAIMDWHFDSKSPADSQIRFNTFYEKYLDRYGLGEKSNGAAAQPGGKVNAANKKEKQP